MSRNRVARLVVSWVALAVVPLAALEFTPKNTQVAIPAKGNDKLSPRCGIALETGAIPDSPNKPQFPNTILRPGEVRESMTEFRFF